MDSFSNNRLQSPSQLLPPLSHPTQVIAAVPRELRAAKSVKVYMRARWGPPRRRVYHRPISRRRPI